MKSSSSHFYKNAKKTLLNKKTNNSDTNEKYDQEQQNMITIKKIEDILMAQIPLHLLLDYEVEKCCQKNEIHTTTMKRKNENYKPLSFNALFRIDE
jgi:hypothetical protein